LSAAFLSLTNIPVESLDKEKYKESLKILNDMKVTPEILEDAIDKMIDKGYAITSLGSCIKGCALEMQRRTAKKKKDGLNWGDFQTHIEIDPELQKKFAEQFGSH
jgi:hypothetical protein